MYRYYYVIHPEIYNYGKTKVKIEIEAFTTEELRIKFNEMFDLLNEKDEFRLTLERKKELMRGEKKLEEISRAFLRIKGECFPPKFYNLPKNEVRDGILNNLLFFFSQIEEGARVILFRSEYEELKNLKNLKKCKIFGFKFGFKS